MKCPSPFLLSVPIWYSIGTRFLNHGQELPLPGEEINLKVKIENDGDFDLDDIKMTVLSTELSLRDSSGPFDLDEGDEYSRIMTVQVPDNAADDEYPLRITISSPDTKRVIYRVVEIR